MFVRVTSIGAPILSDAGAEYLAHAYAGLNTDRTWSGYLVFFPLLGEVSAVSTPAELTTSSMQRIREWAGMLSPTYLQDALRRALALDLTDPESARVAGLIVAAEAIAAENAVDRAVAAVPDALTKAELANTLVKAEDAAAEVARELQERARDEQDEDAAAAIAGVQAPATLHTATTQHSRAAADEARRRSRRSKAGRKGTRSAAGKKKGRDTKK